MARRDSADQKRRQAVRAGLSRAGAVPFDVAAPKRPTAPGAPLVVAHDGPWVMWRAGADVVGVSVHERLEASDAERLARALDTALETIVGPIRLFIDAVELQQSGCGVVAAEVLCSATRALSQRHTFVRIGMAHAAGASGALTAGWSRLLCGAWTSLVSPHVDEVLGHLDLTSEVERYVALRASSRDALALQVVDLLRARPRLRISELADELGSTTARLRAELALRGTTFREESLRRRLDFAREALSRPGAKLDSVAREAGFNSGSHLATALRRQSQRPVVGRGGAGRATSTKRRAPPGARELPRLVDVAHFTRSPLGKCHLGSNWLIWHVDPGLALCSVFGPMGAPELDELFACIDAVLYSKYAPLDVVSDALLAGIKDIGADGMARVYAYTNEHKDRLTTRIRRHAITVAGDPGGAFLAGLGAVNEARHPWRVMGSIEEALTWFGRDDGPELARVVCELIASARDGGALLLEMQLRLRRAPTLQIGEMARALGMSVRALQRACADHGSSFRALQRQVLVGRARELLLESDLKIDSIARELGLRSRSHFVSMFRSATGSSPSAFRRAARGAD